MKYMRNKIAAVMSNEEMQPHSTEFNEVQGLLGFAMPVGFPRLWLFKRSEAITARQMVPGAVHGMS